MHLRLRYRIGATPSFFPRFSQGLRFIAIVWSIAGAFLVLHLGSSELFHRLLVASWIPADLVLPDRGSFAATTCGPSADQTELRVPDPVAAQHVRFVSWKLGRDLGFAAGMANLGHTAAVLDLLMRDNDNLATALAVPTPRLPNIEHEAYAFAEYQAFVRTDPQCVVAALVARFGDVAAHHYRFGLVVGYVMPARKFNFGALFPADLRHYGQLAGVPAALVQPLTLDVLPSPEGRDRTELLMGIVQRIDEHILAAD